MKKLFALLAAMLLAMLVLGVSAENGTYYASPADVTREKLIPKMTIASMLDVEGGVSIIFSYTDETGSNMDDEIFVISYRRDGDLIRANQYSDYTQNDYVHIYFSNDKDDPYLYIAMAGDCQRRNFSTEEFNAQLNAMLVNYATAECSVVDVQDNDGMYIVQTEIRTDGVLNFRDTITLDPVTGNILALDSTFYQNDAPMMTTHAQIIYDANVKIDTSAKEEVLAARERELTFTTADLDGNMVTNEILNGAKLVMLNYWEPWCGPCVREMPDLEKLYQTYKDQGLIILGVFSTNGMDDDARAVVQDTGVTYPILHAAPGLTTYTSEYVPTTVFLTPNGKLLDEPIVGAHTYQQWEDMVKKYLTKDILSLIFTIEE